MTDDETGDSFADFPGLRPMLRWEQFAAGLAQHNRVVPADPGYVEDLLSNALKCATDVASGTTLYRARIHPVEKETETEPLPWPELGMAPRERVKGARLNPERIPYLYCSLEADTAVAEVRPWLGARISIGSFVTKVPMSVVDLRQERANAMGDLDLRAVAHMIGRPVGGDDI